MLLLRGRRAGFNVNGLMLVCWKHSGEQKGQNTSVKGRAECVSCGFRAGLVWLWERPYSDTCMGRSLYSFSEFPVNYVTLWKQQLLLHPILGRAQTAGVGPCVFMPGPCVCSTSIWLRLYPTGRGDLQGFGCTGQKLPSAPVVVGGT